MCLAVLGPRTTAHKSRVICRRHFTKVLPSVVILFLLADFFSVLSLSPICHLLFSITEFWFFALKIRVFAPPFPHFWCSLAVFIAVFVVVIVLVLTYDIARRSVEYETDRPPNLPTDDQRPTNQPTNQPTDRFAYVLSQFPERRAAVLLMPSSMYLVWRFAVLWSVECYVSRR